MSSLIFQSPSTSTTRTWTVWVQDCAPSGVTWHSDPSGAGWLPLFTDFDDVLPEDDEGRGVLGVVDLLQPDVEHLVAGRRRHLLVGVDDPALA